MSEDALETTICGEVNSISYRNEDTGFAVISLIVSDDGGEETVVGELADVNVGERLEVRGEFSVHPVYGRQFRASGATRIFPSDRRGMIRYFSSGVLPGVGVKTAERIVDEFGENSFDALAEGGRKLAEIKGIGRAKAEAISEAFRKIYGIKNAISELGELGISSYDAMEVYKVFGDSSGEIISSNPYMLCAEPFRKSFEEADGIAARVGITGADDCRLRAGLIYVLRHNLGNGHTCLPTEKLIDVTAGFLDTDRDSCEVCFYSSEELGFIAEREIDGRKFAFLPEMLADEEYVSARLRELAGRKFGSILDIGSEIEKYGQKNGIVYSPLQKKAIEASLGLGASIITGGPGTGKTTSIRAVIDLSEKSGEKVMLCAPTGRAAKRLSEVTGHEASTIHRLLEVAVDEKGGEQRFIHNERNPLKADAVIVDEMSMVDVRLFASLLRGMRSRCRLIMVGDPDQLPAVGAGNVLGDILKSGAVPAVRLTEVFRQAQESNIVVSAHQIVKGSVPLLEHMDGDFYFTECQESSVPRLIRDLVAVRIPAAFGFDPYTDIQVMAPGKAGEAGVANLNEVLRDRLNPPAEDAPEVRYMGRTFRRGDKVMQIRNDYDIEWESDSGEQSAGIYNGDIGRIIAVDRAETGVTVKFDDRTASYSFDQLRELEPAFAVTVHKSQGSEFDCVVLSLAGVPKKLRYRNLLYTAVTRARKLLVIVGQQSVIAEMVGNNRKSGRYTGLESFLREG